MPKNGYVTPSNFSKVMTIAQYKKTLEKPDELYKFSATAETYAVHVCRGWLGIESEEITAKALEHGNIYEPVARKCYEDENFILVPELTEPLFHPRLKFVCGTPDGLIKNDGILEIKCPHNPDNHFLNKTEGFQIEQYYAQMQGYIGITGRKWCDFVSYHPAFPEKYRFHSQRIEADSTYIEILEKKLQLFFELVLQKMTAFSPEEATYLKNAYI